jgi:hypothetical protein
MTDIRNLQAFALCMQKTDIKFDLFSITKEMEKQVHIISSLVFFVDHHFPLFCSFSSFFCILLMILVWFSRTSEDDSALKRLDVSC